MSHAPLATRGALAAPPPQRPTERSDPTQHAKVRTGDCPGPRKETETRRNVTRGGGVRGAQRFSFGIFESPPQLLRQFERKSVGKSLYPADPRRCPSGRTRPRRTDQSCSSALAQVGGQGVWRRGGRVGPCRALPTGGRAAHWEACGGGTGLGRSAGGVVEVLRARGGRCIRRSWSAEGGDVLWGTSAVPVQRPRAVTVTGGRLSKGCLDTGAPGGPTRVPMRLPCALCAPTMGAVCALHATVVRPLCPMSVHCRTLHAIPLGPGMHQKGGTSEAAPKAVRQAVGRGCQIGWGRLPSVTSAIKAGTCRQGDGGWACAGGGCLPPFQSLPGAPAL